MPELRQEAGGSPAVEATAIHVGGVVSNSHTDQEFLDRDCREKQIKLQAEEKWKQGLRAERAELERVYWGKQEPEPIEEGYDSCLLPLPLWTAGYAVV